MVLQKILSGILQLAKSHKTTTKKTKKANVPIDPVEGKKAQ